MAVTKNKATPKMNVKEFFAYVEYIAEKKFLESEELLSIMREALCESFATRFDPDAKIDVIINPKTQEFRIVNHSKLVVSDSEKVSPKLRPIEINLHDAKKINKDAKVNDLVSEEVDFASYSNVVATQIHNLFRRGLNAKHKEVVFQRYKPLKGEIVHATVKAVFPNYVLFEIDKGVEGFMPNVMRNHRQHLGLGTKVQVYVVDVVEEGHGSQIIVSNGAPEIVQRFLRLEVPEIAAGTVDVLKIARVPGVRTKIALKSNNPNVDPVGAVVGPRGSRINEVSKQLFDEKIDVIKWVGDPNEFVCSALSPSKVISISEKNYDTKYVIVPNRQHTLAIGKNGSNVKLAAELTGQKIDIHSLDEAVADGVKVMWNGNATPEMVEQIEQGERMVFNRQRSTSTRAPSITDFDQDITSFNTDIQDFDTTDLHRQDQDKEKVSNRVNKTHHKERVQANKSSVPKTLQEEEPSEIQFETGDAELISDDDLRHMEEEFGFDKKDEKPKDKK